MSGNRFEKAKTLPKSAFIVLYTDGKIGHAIFVTKAKGGERIIINPRVFHKSSLSYLVGEGPLVGGSFISKRLLLAILASYILCKYAKSYVDHPLVKHYARSENSLMYVPDWNMDISLYATVGEQSPITTLHMYTPVTNVPMDKLVESPQMRVNHKGQITVNPHGSLTPLQSNIIATKMGLSKEDTSRANTRHTGHKFLRYINNILYAENLNRSIKYAKSVVSTGGKVLFVSVGSKFSKEPRLIDNALGFGGAAKGRGGTKQKQQQSKNIVPPNFNLSQPKKKKKNHKSKKNRKVNQTQHVPQNTLQRTKKWDDDAQQYHYVLIEEETGNQVLVSSAYHGTLYLTEKKTSFSEFKKNVLTDYYTHTTLLEKVKEHVGIDFKAGTLLQADIFDLLFSQVYVTTPNRFDSYARHPDILKADMDLFDLYGFRTFIILKHDHYVTITAEVVDDDSIVLSIYEMAFRAYSHVDALSKTLLQYYAPGKKFGEVFYTNYQKVDVQRDGWS